MKFAKEKLYGQFFWMEFHCLNTTEPIWRERERERESLLFTTELPEFMLSQTWSHPAVFDQGPLDWKSSSLNTRPLQNEMEIKILKNEQLASLTPKWRYWWPTVAFSHFVICKVSQNISHFQGGYALIWHEGTMNHCKKVYPLQTIFCLVGDNL